MSKDINYDKILTEIEKGELVKLNENPILFSAIKKVLLSPIYYQGTLLADPIKNFAIQYGIASMQENPFITNEILGQKLRGDCEAVRLLELGFEELESFKQVEPNKEGKENPGR